MKQQFNKRQAVVSVLNEAERSVRTVLTTETPVLVYDYRTDQVIREILLMDGVEQPELNEVYLLDAHRDWGETKEVLKGSIRNLRVEGNEYVGDAYFSSIAEAEWTLVKEGHLKKVSIGYDTYKDYTIELKPGQEYKHTDNRSFINDFNDGRSLVIRTIWRPREGSFLLYPADEKAGFREGIKADDPELQKALDKIVEEKLNTKIQIKMESKKMSEKTQEQLLQEERERVSKINDLSKRFSGRFKDADAVTSTAVREGWDFARFADHVYATMDTSKAVETPASDVKLSQRELKDYDFKGAIDTLVTKEKREGLAFEISDEISKNYGKKAKGFFVPLPVIKRALLNSNMIRSNTLVGSEGGYLVGTEHDAANFIELLRPLLPVVQLGAQFLSGLRGDVEVPGQTAGLTYYHVNEKGKVNKTKPTFQLITMQPKTIGAASSYTRRMQLQSNPAIEALMISSLMKDIMAGVNKMVYHGSGKNGEPTGIEKWTGVNNESAASFTWAKAVKYETLVESANFEPSGSAYVTTPAVRGSLKSREKVTGQVSFLCDDKNQMNGYPVLASSLIESGYVFFGDHKEIIIGEWSALDVNINPYGDDFLGGGSEVVGLYDYDIMLRYAKAFTYGGSFS